MREAAPTFVYFLRPIGLLGPIKVGCSAEPKKRLEDFLTWSPLPLEILATVPGSLQDEGFLHRCFAKAHSHREWFHPSPEIQRALTIIMAGGGFTELRAALVEVGTVRKKRSPMSANNRRRLSYASRIRIVEKKLRKTETAWHAPNDIWRIMSHWSGFRYWNKKNGWVTVPATEPTPDQIAYLDEYLADPASRSIVPDFEKPKLQVVA